MIRLKQMVFEPPAPEVLEQVTPAADVSRHLRWTADGWLFLVLALCVVRFWLMPLPSSFWVDEMATAFVVQHGAADPSLQVAPQVPASLYYALPKAAILWRVHLILWPLYILFAGYVLWRLVNAETSVSWRAVLAAFGVLAMLLAPVLIEAISLYRQAAAHVIVAVPTLTDLFRSLNLGLLSAFCAGAALLSRWRWWPMVRSLPAASSFGLVLGWWLCQPLCLFAFSSLTHNSVFVSRYLSVALPGAALASTLAVAVFTPARYWKTLSLVLGCGVLFFVGGWTRLWPPHHNSDWRKAAMVLADQSLGAQVPVISPSPFIEAKEPAWRPDYPVNSFLYSHLLAYPVPGRLYPFPFESSPKVERYAAQLSAATLSQLDRFVIYGDAPKVLFWRDWFAARPELAGWHARKMGPYGDVSIVVFEKTP
jgi:hypothetical protein